MSYSKLTRQVSRRSEDQTMPDITAPPCLTWTKNSSRWMSDSVKGNFSVYFSHYSHREGKWCGWLENFGRIDWYVYSDTLELAKIECELYYANYMIKAFKQYIATLKKALNTLGKYDLIPRPTRVSKGEAVVCPPSTQNSPCQSPGKTGYPSGVDYWL